MDDLHGARVLVAGGGVLGFAAALGLVRRGATVVLYEPEATGENASGVAAGMLAPAFETVLDPLSAGLFPLLSAARDLWPAFIETLETPAAVLEKSGGVWVFGADDAKGRRLFSALRDQGSQAEFLTSEAVAELHPTLGRGVSGGVYTPEDWVLDPGIVLPAMALAYRRAGGRVVRCRLTPSEVGFNSQGAPVEADAIVLATGSEGAAWLDLAPELGVIEPVKGQLAQLDAPPFGGPAVRGDFGYVTPQAHGAVVGATMQAGLADRSVDPEIIEGLRTGAAEMFPHFARAPVRGRAGVRASTPDGLPLVGRSSQAGLLLALGARRNGWLLAPLVGELIASCLLGRDGGPFASALRPSRTFPLSNRD